MGGHHRRIPARSGGWARSEVARKAVLGKRGIYPDEGEDALLGVDLYEELAAKLPSLDDLLLVPPQFTPLRLRKALELGREPLFSDVRTEATLGGFRVRLPLAVAAMGSAPAASRRALSIARGAARAGIIYSIGENVVTVHGYDRSATGLPSFKERALAYLQELREGYGGLVIQQSVEDANYELWKKVYSDPDFDEFIRAGLVAFELKAGQGAKPGIGGEILVRREDALRLVERFHFDDDPRLVQKELYERHSVPGTYTEEIMAELLRGMINEYRSQARKVRIWLKTGPYRDLDRVLRVAASTGVDAITVDGKEGGTGMSPSVALRSLGLPLVSCLASIRRARRQGVGTHVIVSGEIRDGADLVNVLCLGAHGAAMGRPFIVAAEARYMSPGGMVIQLEAGEQGVTNFVEALRTEVQMLVSALGKYDLAELDEGDIAGCDRQLSEALGIRCIY
jgi:glutamate synthase domain-containing protein 2